MITTIIFIAIVVTPLWFLQDTIAEFLSNGKSFAPNETKWN